MGVVVTGAVDAKAGRDAVPREGDSVEVVLRHGAQHRHGHHAVIGVQIFGIDGRSDGLRLVPRGGVYALHDALRLGDDSRLLRRRGGGRRGGSLLGLLRCGGCGGLGVRHTAPAEPEKASPGADQRQNYDQHQKHPTLAASACDLAAIGIKISHKSSCSPYRLYIVIIRPACRQYK